MKLLSPEVMKDPQVVLARAKLELAKAKHLRGVLPESAVSAAWITYGLTARLTHANLKKTRSTQEQL